MDKNQNITRCTEDSYLCTVDEPNTLLTEPLKYLCYYTGDLLYNITNNFGKVKDRYYFDEMNP